jgi:sugar phosphate isomerase/epimerase
MSDTTRREFLAKSMLAATGLSAGFTPYQKAVSGIKPIAGLSNLRADTKAPAKVCVFSKHLAWLNYQDMADFALQAGFDGIDLTVRPGGHVVPENVVIDLPKAVKAVRDKGLEVHMLTTAITDPKEPHTEAILRTASQLGIKYYRTGWLRYQENQGTQQNLESFRTKLSGLAKLNKQYAIHGAYQNHSGLNLGAPVWDLWMLIKDMDPRWLGCQYDIRHATIEGALSWPMGLELLRNHIQTIDIKDFHWSKTEGKWQIEDVPLGEGMVDFKKYLSLLKQYSISGPISLHFEYPLGGADEGKKELTISKEKVLEVMRKDLSTLRNWLKEAGIS